MAKPKAAKKAEPAKLWVRNKSNHEVSDGRDMIAVGAIVEVDEATAEILIGCGACELIAANPDDPDGKAFDYD